MLAVIDEEIGVRSIRSRVLARVRMRCSLRHFFASSSSSQYDPRSSGLFLARRTVPMAASFLYTIRIFIFGNLLRRFLFLEGKDLSFIVNFI